MSAPTLSEHQPTDESLSPDLRELHALIEAERAAFVEGGDGRKRAGYFCAYTPPEILDAAGLRHARLFRAGSPETVSNGERYTQSVFCDFSKSCIGAFDRAAGAADPFYLAVDRLYAFHTCASMKRAVEVIERFVPTVLLNLPRLRGEAASRAYLAAELRTLRDDAAALAGRAVTDDDVSEQILLYNSIRRLVRKLSELRQRADPPLTGLDFLEIVRGFYYLPPQVALEAYTKLYRRCAQRHQGKARPARLLIAGSIMADGDRRLVELVERQAGARIVAEDHCTGLRPFRHEIAEAGDPFVALANGYLDQAPCARMKPLGDSLDAAATLAREYEVEGVLYVYLKFCACYGVSKLAFVERFREEGVPVLELSSDYSVSDVGQFATRVEAFLEVLQDRRAERRQAAPALAQEYRQ